MQIGLASDSHGNVEALERALELFARARVDRVFFLGGRLADLDAALARRTPRAGDAAVPATGAVQGAPARQPGAGADPLGGRIVRVASRACPEYAAGGSARKQVDLVEGRICCLVHDKSELTREDIANATVLFHGNSGRAALVQIGPRYFVTPGRLRAPAPGDGPPTCAVLEVGARDLVLTVYGGAGERLRQDRASFAAGSKMAVR